MSRADAAMIMRCTEGHPYGSGIHLMRFAHRAGVILVALAVSALSQPADAAQGRFTFRYTADGHTRKGALDNPVDGKCIDVTGSVGGSGRADTGKNRTRTVATVYLSIDCEDDGVLLLPGETHPIPFKTVRFG
ncbi:hypothetical protein OTB20_39000 [Streptomyces sp. H27-H1]|uniref:hypothetical protein n=1 Tax=Streptomyces sp. H27-H1 TaxID=2996461 RepID=UPI00227041AD|nr:hypothetical protein [Streptomyces sp. H27-H1]MCY0932058.1 hypothetical protein [Streptomyces sp. H27-H1]